MKTFSPIAFTASRKRWIALMVIVDSSVWIDYLNGTENAHTVLLDDLLATECIGLTNLILAEVLRGVRDESSASIALEALSQFRILDGGGEHLAVRAAGSYRTLRSRGVTVRGTIDCLTATFCLQGEHTLLHRDRDFVAFEQLLGLQVFHPDRH